MLGNEIPILKGAAKILSNPETRPTYIHCEFWPTGTRRAGHKPEELLEILRSYHYYCYNAYEAMGPTEPFLIEDPKKHTELIDAVQSPLIPPGHGPWTGVFCIHESELKV